MNKKIIITLIFLLTFSSFVSAQVLPANDGKFEEMRQKREEAMEEKKEQFQERRQERLEQICLHLNNKAENRIGRYEKRKAAHLEKYDKLTERLSSIVEKLEEKGYDISMLNAHLADLEDLIKDYEFLYEEFIGSLGFVRGYACGDSEEDFKDSLSESKEALRLVKEMRLEIRNFYRSEIRNDIQEIRKQNLEDGLFEY